MQCIFYTKASCPPEKIDPLFWFYRFSQSPKLELQKATAVDTEIEQFNFRTGSKIKATGSRNEQVKFELDPPMLDTNEIKIVYHHQWIHVSREPL